MEDPQPLPNDDPSSADDDALELQRRAEEAMEQMLLEQEEEEEEITEAQNYGSDDHLDDDFFARDPADGEDLAGVAPDDDDGNNNNGNMHDDMAFLDDEDLMNNNGNTGFGDVRDKKNPFTYIRLSCLAAVFLVYYAYRSRQQWYLALVFLSSCKYAYVILGNAYIAVLIWMFRVTTGSFLDGLRVNEAEGLGDYFRWHITETCLALTIFRSELNVKTFMLFLFLVFSKCLHHVVDAREAHLRMTEEVVVANPSSGWPSLRYPHVKIFVLINILQVLDVISMVLCGQDIMNHGPSVAILFAFENAIMLTSVVSNALLWNLHLMDGILHYLHEASDASSVTYRWIYPWKDHKPTLMFVVELQAQAAKFIFYTTFFAIVFTYYGLPINLIREVYVSFMQLKSRVVAFKKYRKLMACMNRFESPTEEELEKERICIICREEMTVETAKKLPGCGHIFRKSCLREWLVQQQTCPTCRGDISVMEARQRQQEQSNARAQEEQEERNRDQEQVPREGEEETTNGGGTTEGGRTTEDNGSTSGPVHECCKRRSAAPANNETMTTTTTTTTRTP
mmetsp:Transcript_18949/g.43970  ORF Transcript_18949/g.43970 Transcript_18949/m.43970 type:complete len:566 (-) Transcript_18949:454-2151(-)